MSLQVNDTFTINTGRQYDTAQVLECAIVKRVDNGGDWYDEVTINVVDASRHMKFHVTVLVDVEDTEQDVKREIIGAYDKGTYSPGHLIVEPPVSFDEVTTVTEEPAPKAFKVLSLSNVNPEVARVECECDDLQEARCRLMSIVEGAEINEWDTPYENEDFNFSRKGADWCRVWIEGEGVERPQLKFVENLSGGYLTSQKIERQTGLTAKEQYLAIVKHITEARFNGLPVRSKTLQNIATDKYLSFSLHTEYSCQVIITSGFHGSQYYCDLDCNWTEIEL